jgi:DNA topoisomerase III
MVGKRILCVAEKNSIAKAVANHLGGNVQVHSVTGNQYLKNYQFDYNFGPPWGACSVTFTAVAGHVMDEDFHDSFGWGKCEPGALFDAPIVRRVHEKHEATANNIKRQAGYCSSLFIWTDCDREGENIGAEIRDLALAQNPRLEVKRARFSNIERAHIVNAARNPINLDDRQANAVWARREIDLRTGAAFTRILTLHLKPMIIRVDDSVRVISYGSCQFPTLGFVVDRYFRVKRFISEPFWSIKVVHKKNSLSATFSWARNHLFDRMSVFILYERCLTAKIAKVINMQKRPTSKWKPLPLTTVELQKLGSKYLRMNSSQVMKVAEDLYTKGFISYPRTETDQFDRGMNLRGFIEKQTQDNRWGQFAQGLVNGGFQWPRQGSHDDKAHPPIHPVNYVTSGVLNEQERRVYEFVVRRFLACCSHDAKGELTQIEILYEPEIFKASGLRVIERNYLDVYPYDKWESSQQLPEFQLNETFIPTEAKMTEGKTSPPGYLTEPELIAMMDANGIGTDATMADHIAKIKERDYVQTRFRSGAAAAVEEDSDEEELPAVRSRGRGRGQGRGRGGRGGSTNAPPRRGRGVEEFIPTNLGVALIEGYENLRFETSLSKPFLRKEVSFHF